MTIQTEPLVHPFVPHGSQIKKHWHPWQPGLPEIEQKNKSPFNKNIPFHSLFQNARCSYVNFIETNL